jgi:AbiV family abortive infection protein
MSPKRASGPLTPTNLAEIAVASLANAVDLIAEARALFEAGAVARAYSIAILAGEEFGKCQLAIGAFGRLDSGAAYWKDWWSTYYGHGAKLARAAQLAVIAVPPELMAAFIGLLTPALRDQRRESGFYVDFVNGEALAPAQAIGADEAANAIGIFGEVIDHYSPTFADVSLKEAYLDAYAGDAAEMRAAIESRDRERIRDTWTRTVGRTLGDDELDEMMSLLDKRPSRR